MKIKNISKKLIICLMVFLLLFNFMISSVSKYNTVLAATNEELAAEAEEEADNLFGTFLNGLAGILTMLPRLIINGLSMLCQSLAFFVMDTAGHGDTEVSALITPFDIFFNKFTLTNIDIFHTDDIEQTSGGDMVYGMREFAAMLYYVVRAISIAILLILLIVIGIKMALATLAEDKAKAKKLFIDWVISLGFVIFIHYIILGIIMINEALVGIIENIATSADISNAMDSLRSAAFSANFLLGWGSTIAYAMITFQIMFFVIIYVVRFIKVTLLIIIAPAIPLTYSLDKANTGLANALNKWFKEFCYNVFIQVLHCIIYVIIIAIPMAAIENVSIGSISSLTAPIILIISLMCVKKAEELLKSLFGFNDAISVTSYSSTTNAVYRAVGTSISIANGTYTVTNNTSNNTTTFGSNIQSLGERATNKVHEYRNRAASWLDGQEQMMNSSRQQNGAESQNANTNTDENESGDSNENIVVNETVSNAENGEQDGAPTLLLTDDIISDSDMDRVAEAVASTRHDEEENRDRNENINIIEENEEIEEYDTEEVARESRPLTDDEIREREELKELYQRMLEELKQANEAQKTIQTKLDDLAEKLDDDEVDRISQQIQDIFEREGMIAAVRYARSLGQTAQGAFAREYVRYLDNRNKMQGLIDAGEGRLINMINNGVEDGVIDEKQGMALYNNAIKFANGEDDKSDEILELNTVEENTSDNNIEVVSGDVVNITDDLNISKEALKEVIRNTREATINNSKILEAIEGEITVEGDFSESNIIDFNTKIMEKARNGYYSESNLQKAEEAVKKEGDIAVRRLEKFKAEQSEANARMLTPAGKKYAELMVEAQQAGMFIVSASMAESNDYSESSSRNVSTRRNTVNISGQQAAPTNRSNDVLNDLNQRRKYA